MGNNIFCFVFQQAFRFIFFKLQKAIKKYLTRLCYFKYADTFFAIEMIFFGESEDILDFFVPRPELQYIHTPELDTHSKRLHFYQSKVNTGVYLTLSLVLVPLPSPVSVTCSLL